MVAETHTNSMLLSLHNYLILENICVILNKNAFRESRAETVD